MENSMFTELRCNYFDDFTHEWCVDGWVTDDGDEEGFVVARINEDTFEVTYTDSKFKKDNYVLETIKNKLKEIVNRD